MKQNTSSCAGQFCPCLSQTKCLKKLFPGYNATVVLGVQLYSQAIDFMSFCFKQNVQNILMVDFSPAIL